MTTLFTIGYEQATAKAFFDALTKAGVATLIDVRAVAASRRPGFSKRQLAAGLDEHGMAYVHLQKLGTPKEGRLAARSGHAAEMLRIYERHLETAGGAARARGADRARQVRPADLPPVLRARPRPLPPPAPRGRAAHAARHEGREFVLRAGVRPRAQ